MSNFIGYFEKNKRTLIFGVLISFSVGFFLGYQLQFDFLSKDANFVDLSKEAVSENTIPPQLR